MVPAVEWARLVVQVLAASTIEVYHVHEVRDGGVVKWVFGEGYEWVTSGRPV